MSYDLYFKPRNGTFTADDFAAYFGTRPYFTHTRSQAVYENPDTGVYFSFDLQGESNDDGDEQFPIALNINFFRPSYFILEAEPVVSAFVRECDLLISDSQIDGMGDGEYQAEKLATGWNKGNRFAFSAFKDQVASGAVYHLPTARLHAAWKWNLARERLQAEVSESQFVAKVMFLKLDGKAVSAAVWPDGISVILPAVDVVCVRRDELAPTKFFRKQEDVVLVPWVAVLPILRKHGSAGPEGSVSLSWVEPPAEVVKFIKSLPKDPRTLEAISQDDVLDLELVEQALR